MKIALFRRRVGDKASLAPGVNLSTTLNTRFTALESRFLKHRISFPWLYEEMSGGKTIQQALSEKCVSITQYNNGRVVHLLNKGNNMDLAEKELIELEQHVKKFDDYNELMTLVIERGKKFTIHFAS